jgi:hypothetical protein
MRYVLIASVVWLTMVQGSIAGDAPATSAARSTGPSATAVVSLDGADWLLATDPQNIGRQQHWYRASRPEAKPTKVPWIIQDAFPGYHGVAWYWREFPAPVSPHAAGRYLLRFWAVDYTAEVWLNGTRVGGHEGGETPFVLDVTDTVRPGRANLLAVRVLNPTHEPIDGIVLDETPHRNKALPYRAGSAWDQGGIIDSVELLATPAVRIDDLFVRPDWRTGTIRVQAEVHNAATTFGGARPAGGRLELTVAPASSGETLAIRRVELELPSGDTPVETELKVNRPRLWELSDPFLYRVTARVFTGGSSSFDERSVRCGFRDFRFQEGDFRLNGRRIYLRCSHTGNCCPIGLELPHDPDLLRRDLVNAKAMRFNAIRFIAGVPKRYQLDLCDEIGLMVYEESYAAWCLADSPQMARRYDQSVLGMIRRDRNHPSVVIWGLLNETPPGAVFRHAVGLLPAVRQQDDSRLVMLNSGRWDLHGGGVAGINVWRNPAREDPCVTFNPTKHVIRGLGITWAPGELAFHPGRGGEYSVVRWTAPADDRIDLRATFRSIAEKATTDVHVLHNHRALFDGLVNLGGAGRQSQGRAKLSVKKGDTIDCVVGFGNGDYGADTTALALVVKSAAGKTYDAAAGFSVQQNPNGVWSYGQLAPGTKPDATTFTRYAKAVTETALGGLSNPGSMAWEDLLHDQHPYPRVPHTADIIRYLRTLDGQGRPLLISEYGIGSAVDLLRVVRLYEQLGKASAEDAQFYAALRDRYLADWQRWKMQEAFDRPEDFFAQSIQRMAGQRLLGINAIRSNPNVVGYSLTGTVDQGMTGEGLWTTFRELKPGTADALCDGLAPLRWCLFVEPVHAYRGTPIRLEAVLANEDALSPGEYPVRFEVVGPHSTRVFQETRTVSIAGPSEKGEPPMVMPVFAKDVVVDGPPGKYRFLATFQQGAAAAGEAVEFYLGDPAQMPPVETEIVLWGGDPELAGWLAQGGIHVRPFSPEAPAGREVILVSRTPPARPAGAAAPQWPAAAFRELARRIARGSTAVFLCPEVFMRKGQATGWLPLQRRGSLVSIPSWLYLKDDWAKPHPIFEGLPTGLMDFTFYREIIPDLVWAGQDPPAEAVAGSVKASQDYSSGLLVAVYELGAGRLILNTLRIRENLGRHPVAEHLLRNMLRYAGRDLDKPRAKAPADLDALLETLGYRR